MRTRRSNFPAAARRVICLLNCLLILLSGMPLQVAAAPQKRTPVKTSIAKPDSVKVKTGPHRLQKIDRKKSLSAILSDPDPSDAEITRARIFLTPLVPMSGKPVQGENKGLAAAIKAFRDRGDLEDLSALESFLERYPQSRWAASLEENMAEIAFSRGYLSDALRLFEDSWKRSAAEKGAAQKAVADEAVTNLIVINARLGRLEQLRKLLSDVRGRPMYGSSESKINGARQAIWLMDNQPHCSFKCGPYAVNTLRNLGRVEKEMHPAIEKAESTKEGTSLARVKELADKVGIDYKLARREKGAKIITPCVMHWSLDHFGALVKEENGKYLLKDPTFDTDGEVWLTSRAIERETDGYFLVPANASLDDGWSALSMEEARKVRGKGVATNTNKNQMCCKKCTAPGGCCDGMAVASYYPHLGTLTIDDTPLSYQPPLGPSMDFHVTYNHLQTNQPGTFAFTNLGQNWNLNWLSYLTLNGTTATVRLREGKGSEVFTQSGGTYTNNFVSQALLVDMGGGVYERRLPDGTVEVFNLADTSSPVRIFLTEVKDPQGNSVLLQYDADYRLVSITDAINQVSTLSYVSDTPVDPGFYKLDRITDPFGRSCRFFYDATTTNLTKIVDVIDLASDFAYDQASSFITLMTTPYGSTSFYQYQTGTQYFSQGLRFTFPDDSQAVVENWIGGPDETYYWDRQAMELYPNDPANQIHTHCLTTKFTHNLNTTLLDPSPQSITSPLETSPTFMTYAGSLTPRWSGTTMLPGQTTRSLGNNGNLVVNATIEGTAAAGEVVTIGANFVSISYTVQAGDTTADIATALALAANASADFRTRGITAGAVKNVVSLQSDSAVMTNGYSYTVSPGSATTVKLNSMVRQTQVMTLGGPVTAGNVTTFHVNKPNWPNNGRVTFTYTTQAGDTLSTIVSNLASQINADATAQLYGVSAIASGSDLLLTSYSPDVQTYGTGTTGSQTFAFSNVLNGNTQTSQYLYNSFGHMTRSIDPMRRTTSYSYAPNSIDLVEVRETQGGNDFLMSHWDYNSQHLPVLYIDGSGQQTQYSYNSSGQLLSTTDANGDTTSFTYTGTATATLGGAATSGDTLTITVHDAGLSGGQEPVSYIIAPTDTLASAAAGLAAAITANTSLAAIGVSASSQGQVITLTSTSVNVTSYSQSVSPGATETIALTENRFGYLTKIDGPLPGDKDVTLLSYDGFGRLFTQTDSEGYTLVFEYDDMNRPVKTIYPDGTSETTIWDRLDAVLTTDRNGRTTERAYDSLDQLIRETDPLGRKTSYSWCSCGSLTSITDGNGNKTTWEHDLQGRVTAKIYADSTTVSYLYEAATGRLKAMTDALGQIKTYLYYPDGRLYQSNYSDAVNTTQASTFLWDLNYPRMVGSQKNDWGGYAYLYNPYVTSSSGPPTTGGGMLQKVSNDVITNSDITYQYDSLGRTVNRSIDGANNSITWQYDPMSRVTGETNALGAFAYHYVDDTPGSSKGVTRLSSIDYPNGQVTAFDYFDNLGDQRLKTIHNMKPGGGTLSKFIYGYDPAGQITKWKQKQQGEMRHYTIGYDQAGQLVSYQGSLGKDKPPPYIDQYFYSYDPGANRTSVQRSVGDAARITGSATAGDKLRIKVHDEALTGGEKVIVYTVQAGDTIASAAQNLASAMTKDPDMQAIGVSAAALTATSGPEGTIGAELVFRSASDNLTRFTKSTSTGATASIDMSIMLNGTENAFISGTLTPGDVLTIMVEDASLAGGQEPVSYTVQSGDNFKAVAAGLAAAVNANSNLQAVGVKALAYGRVVSLTSLSTKETSYSKSFSPGSTENIFFSTSINGALTAVIGGTVTAGDQLTITVFDRGIGSGSQAVSYTVQAGDTLDTIATALAAAINVENSLSNEGISATAVGPVISILSHSRNLTTASQSLSPGATETIAMSPAANVTGYGYNNVNELTSIAPGGNANFRGTTNKAVKSVTVGATPATLDSTRDFSTSAPLSPGSNDVAVTAIDGGNNSKTENFQIPVRGQQSAALTFDANGNMTSNGTGQTYEWDAENRLIKINYPGTGNNSEFTYDGWGRNVKLVENTSGSPTSTKQFVWVGVQQSEERDSAGAMSRQHFALGQINGSTKFYFQKDQIGSVRTASDVSGAAQSEYSYDPFGRMTIVSDNASIDFRYAHYYYHDRSGFYLTLARAYDPAMGRFISRDPITENGSGTNLYAYVDNLPISASDPSGLQNVVDAHGHQTLMGTEMFENVTGAPHGQNIFGAGCVAVAGFYLGINPGSLPESPHSGLPSGSTHCWWGGSPGNLSDVGPAKKKACAYKCPPGTKKVIWCKQGYVDQGSRGPSGSPVSDPAGPWDNSGGLFNYSVYFPETNTFIGMNTSGGCGYSSPNIPGAATSPSMNGAMCCATCLKKKGK